MGCMVIVLLTSICSKDDWTTAKYVRGGFLLEYSMKGNYKQLSAKYGPYNIISSSTTDDA